MVITVSNGNDRIRLIGRLFFISIVVMLKKVEIERGNFVNLSQNVLRKSNYLGIIWGQLGQGVGQINQESSSDSW
jgi:hypothetical protein